MAAVAAPAAVMVAAAMVAGPLVAAAMAVAARVAAATAAPALATTATAAVVLVPLLPPARLRPQHLRRTRSRSSFGIRARCARRAARARKRTGWMRSGLWTPASSAACLPISAGVGSPQAAATEAEARAELKGAALGRSQAQIVGGGGARAVAARAGGMGGGGDEGGGGEGGGGDGDGADADSVVKKVPIPDGWVYADDSEAHPWAQDVIICPEANLSCNPRIRSGQLADLAMEGYALHRAPEGIGVDWKGGRLVVYVRNTLQVIIYLSIYIHIYIPAHGG